VEHRAGPPYQSTNQNLSNSSISSSTNSAGTPSSTMLPPYGTWPVRLGPVPFKSQFSVDALPPKPTPVPPFPGVGTGGLKKVSGGTPPLRKISSVERLSMESEFEERTSSPRLGATTQTVQRLKSMETSSNTGTFHYDSRLFGSLDSLQNLANGSKENLSSDGELISVARATLTLCRVRFNAIYFSAAVIVRRPRYWYTNFRHMTS